MDRYKSTDLTALTPRQFNGEERRTCERVALKLTGRYMLPDRSEFRCDSINISPEGALLRGPRSSEQGSRVVVHLDRIGSVEAVIAWTLPQIFAIRFIAPPRKTEKIAKKIEWLVGAGATGDQRGNERLLQNYDRVTIERADGVLAIGALEDLSDTGAAIITGLAFQIGDRVLVNGRAAIVARCFDSGIGVAF